ncbi:MAG: hypothetical protein WCB63_19595 [Polyangiales bacterium]
MSRFGLTFAVASLLLVVLVGACSFVVDFDRSLLPDAGLDGGVDAGADAAGAFGGTLVDAGVDTDALADED